MAWWPWYVSGPAGTPLSLAYNGAEISQAQDIRGELSGLVLLTVAKLDLPVAITETLALRTVDPEDGPLWARRALRVDDRTARLSYAGLSATERANLIELWECVGTALPFKITLPGESATWWVFAEDLPLVLRSAQRTQATLDFKHYERTADL